MTKADILTYLDRVRRAETAIFACDEAVRVLEQQRDSVEKHMQRVTWPMQPNMLPVLDEAGFEVKPTAKDGLREAFERNRQESMQAIAVYQMQKDVSVRSWMIYQNAKVQIEGERSSLQSIRNEWVRRLQTIYDEGVLDEAFRDTAAAYDMASSANAAIATLEHALSRTIEMMADSIRRAHREAFRQPADVRSERLLEACERASAHLSQASICLEQLNNKAEILNFLKYLEMYGMEKEE